MPATIKDLIQSATEKDVSEFEATFADIMSAKIDDALGSKYDAMFGSGVSADSDEEVDVEIEHEDA